MFTAASDALARALVTLRKGAGMTQRDLAASVGREQNYIARIEQGQRRVDLVEWVQLIRACGADPEAELLRILREVIPLVPLRRRTRKG